MLLLLLLLLTGLFGAAAAAAALCLDPASHHLFGTQTSEKLLFILRLLAAMRVAVVVSVSQAPLKLELEKPAVYALAAAS